MRSHVRGAVLLLLLGAALAAGGDSPFTLPVPPPSPVPPAPAPGAVPVLSGDALYVVNSRTDAIARAHPAGLVRVTKEPGPLTIRARFSDGAKVETRKFPGPFVFIVEPLEKGRATIDLIPVGVKTESEILGIVLDVGTGPQPPPSPKPDPDPPGPDVRAEKVWVIVVEKASDPRTPDTAKALNDPFWQTLKPKHEWRHYLTTSDTAIKNNYVKLADEVGYPAVLVLDAATGKPLKKFKLTTAAEIDAAVKAVAK